MEPAPSYLTRVCHNNPESLALIMTGKRMGGTKYISGIMPRKGKRNTALIRGKESII